MNKNIKNEVVNEVVTMVKQIVVIVAFIGAVYAVETAVARHTTGCDEMRVKVLKDQDCGQRGRGGCARYDAG